MAHSELCVGMRAEAALARAKHSVGAVKTPFTTTPATVAREPMEDSLASFGEPAGGSVRGRDCGGENAHELCGTSLCGAAPSADGGSNQYEDEPGAAGGESSDDEDPGADVCIKRSGVGRRFTHRPGGPLPALRSCARGEYDGD